MALCFQKFRLKQSGSKNDNLMCLQTGYSEKVLLITCNDSQMTFVFESRLHLDPQV